MSARENALTISNAEKRYRGKLAVMSVNLLSMSLGESILLHGRNGSGKSTLLRVMARVAQLDEGDIAYSKQLQRGRLGYLPQSGGLYPELSLEDNFRLRRRLFGLKPVRLKSMWYVRELGLIRFLGKRVSEMSGGYQRLAAIAATLHVEPTWLLMDEPLSGVDTEMREDLLGWFAELAHELDLFVLAAPVIEDGQEAACRIEMEDGRIK